MSAHPTTPWGSLSAADDPAPETAAAPVGDEISAVSKVEQVKSPSSVWTIPALCLGIAVIACCILIPAADENRRIAYERERLKADLTQLQKQASVNDAFLAELHQDPTLAERLAQRQMKMVREGTGVLKLDNNQDADLISPYLLVTVPPPAEMPPYQPVGGMLAELVRPAKNQLYLIGVGLLMVAIGLVFGADADSSRRDAPE